MRQRELPRDLARRFLVLAPGETIENEYLVAHTDTRRFTPFTVAALTAAGLAAAGLFVAGSRQAAVAVLAVAAVVALWLALRRLEITVAHTVLTNERIVLYLRCDHPRENYHYLSEAALDEVTGVWALAGRGLLRKFISVFVWTPRDVPIALAAWGFRGPFAGLLGQAKTRDERLIPGPDALAFVQEVSARVHELQERRRADRRVLAAAAATSSAAAGTSSAPAPPESGVRGSWEDDTDPRA